MNNSNEKILCVDDEIEVLNSIKRALRGVCEMEFADSAEIGLEYLKSSGPYAVIISDMRMPGMDGISFLEESSRISPDSSRIMLSGVSDQSTAIDALNRGDLFRYLKKPFSNEDLKSVIEAGIKSYRLATAEKDLLQRTLSGSVRALVDILSMADPKAFQMSSRLREVSSQLGRIQNMESIWMLDIASMLAPVGCVALASEFDDMNADPLNVSPSMAEAWKISSKIVKRIPRLEKVAAIIELSLKKDVGSVGKNANLAQMAAALKTAYCYAHLRRKRLSKDDALQMLCEIEGELEQRSVIALSEVDLPEDKMISVELSVNKLEEGMIFSDDVFTIDGLMLAPGGLRVSEAILSKIQIFGREDRLPKSISVLVTPEST